MIQPITETKVIYKITYPNGKIYINKALTIGEVPTVSL